MHNEIRPWYERMGIASDPPVGERETALADHGHGWNLEDAAQLSAVIERAWREVSIDA